MARLVPSVAGVQPPGTHRGESATLSSLKRLGPAFTVYHGVHWSPTTWKFVSPMSSLSSTRTVRAPHALHSWSLRHFFRRARSSRSRRRSSGSSGQPRTKSREPGCRPMRAASGSAPARTPISRPFRVAEVAAIVTAPQSKAPHNRVACLPLMAASAHYGDPSIQADPVGKPSFQPRHFPPTSLGDSSRVKPASRISDLRSPRPSSRCFGTERRRPADPSRIVWLPSVRSRENPIRPTMATKSSPERTGRRATATLAPR